jgi:hypothetical protein
MLEGYAPSSRQEVIPAGRLNLDRGKAGPDHIDGAQKTIVGIDEADAAPPSPRSETEWRGLGREIGHGG